MNAMYATTVRGHAGERFVADELGARLAEVGIGVRVMYEEGRPTAEFDLLAGPIIASDGDEASFVPVVGIENKDLSVGRSARPDRYGTRITKAQKRRKLAFADEAGLVLAITTVSVRHTGQIGHLFGLVNRPAIAFNYDLDALVDAIIAACGGASR